MKYTTENIEKYDLRYYEKHGWKGWRSHRPDGVVKNKWIVVDKCEICGESFFSSYKNISKYCSVDCRNKYMSKVKIPRRNYMRVREIKKRERRTNWEKFYRSKDIILYDDYWKRYKTEHGKIRRSPLNKVLLEAKCKVCGKWFLLKWSKIICGKVSGFKYCSVECILHEKNKFKVQSFYYKQNIATYDSWAERIGWCEEVRRSPMNKVLLEVKCRYCGKWFMPTMIEVKSRHLSINCNHKGERLLYCSEGCKQACPVFKQILYPKDFKIATSREVQPELRQMVLERDEWTCQKCGAVDIELHCHHLEGILWEPLESSDIDMCITYCVVCHKEAHSKEGCGYNDLKCPA